jgi:RNA polymerase sigma-70 factor (ECF subfamily)
MARPLTTSELEELYRSTVHDLLAYARRRGSADPENDVAEVYAIAWRRRSDLPAPMLRRAWLFGTAAKVLQAGHRRRVAEGYAVAELAQRPVEPAGATSDGGVAAVVAGAMDRLAPGDREVLRLVEWERLTPAELATALDVRPGTARVRLHRARRALASDPEVRALVDRGASDDRLARAARQG